MIEVKNLTKIFNEGSEATFHALKNISFTIRDNELVLLKGVSGSGKSTLLAIIASLLKPSSGDVVVEGRHVAKLPDLHASKFRATTIGFIFQSFNLLDHLSVSENIAVPLIPMKLPKTELIRRVEHAMELANISHKRDTTAKNLSGGEKQRCAIARALVNTPKVILCDEPTANLDLDNAHAFVEVIRRLKQEGYTILIATHDTIFDTLQEVDRTIAIENGEILQ